MGCSSSSQARYSKDEVKNDEPKDESKGASKEEAVPEKIDEKPRTVRSLSICMDPADIPLADEEPPTIGEMHKSEITEFLPVKEESASPLDMSDPLEAEKANILDMVSSKCGAATRRRSVDTVTNDERQAFSDKPIDEQSTKVGEKVGLGHTCRKGLKPDSPNQDSFSVLQVDAQFSIYGVYDGHGHKGHHVSNYVRELLPKLILGDKRFRTPEMPAMLADKFKKTQEMIDSADAAKTLSAAMSGTTCTVLVHDHVSNQITVSHVADSTAVLARYSDASHNELKAVQLTRDHKPDLADERARIEAAGGRVIFDGYSNYRVYAKNARYPGLNMSRCLGDLLGHREAGCSAVPEVNEMVLTPEDHMLLLCSDGVWEFMSPQQAVDIVAEFGPGMAMKAAEVLAQKAWDLWIKEEGGTVVDDITVVLVYLQSDQKGL